MFHKEVAFPLLLHSIISQEIHSMPGTVPGSWDESVNEAKFLALAEPTLECGGQKRDKDVRSVARRQGLSVVTQNVEKGTGSGLAAFQRVATGSPVSSDFGARRSSHTCSCRTSIGVGGTASGKAKSRSGARVFKE